MRRIDFVNLNQGLPRGVNETNINKINATDNNSFMKPRSIWLPSLRGGASIISLKTDTHNQAMTVRGGIDMNSANLNLHIKRDGNGIPMLSRADLAQISENFDGLDPVIISIKSANQTALFSQLIGQH